MNQARIRRQKLQQRVKEIKNRNNFYRRFVSMEEQEPEHITTNTIPSIGDDPLDIKSRLIDAVVVLQYGVRMYVKLPENSLTRKIKEMQDNGFWHVHSGSWTFVPSGKIQQVEVHP